MIDFRRAAYLLPVYVAAMLAVDALFDMPAWGRPGEVPIWLLSVFTAMAVAVFVIVGRYLFGRNRPAVPSGGNRAMLAVLAGVVVTGVLNDLLAGVVRVTLHTRSIWVMVPIYVLTYLLFFAVIRWVLSAGARSRE